MAVPVAIGLLFRQIEVEEGWTLSLAIPDWGDSFPTRQNPLVQIALVGDFGGMRLSDRIRIKLTFPIMRHKVGDCRRSRLQPCAVAIELETQSGDRLMSGRSVY